MGGAGNEKAERRIFKREMMDNTHSDDFKEWIKMMNLLPKNRNVPIIKSRSIGPTTTRGGKTMFYNAWININEARKNHLNIRIKSILIKQQETGKWYEEEA